VSYSTHLGQEGRVTEASRSLGAVLEDLAAEMTYAVAGYEPDGMICCLRSY
jgi:hypothetical protein